MFDNFELLFNIFSQSKKIPFKNKKRVHFSPLIYIYFIPLYNLNHSENLWWNEVDLYVSKQNAINEILQLQQKHPLIERKDAEKLLYQPNNISSYDPSNFDLSF